MAHHSSEPFDSLRRDVREMALDNALGETGEYPRGRMHPTDEGEIQMAVAADMQTKTVVVNFGKPVAWLGLEYDDAIGLANAIRDNAFKLRGITAG